MKPKQVVILTVVLNCLLNVIDNVSAQGTAFAYQGQLSASGSPANGKYDFTFALFNNSSTNIGQVGSTLTNFDLGVTNGLFAVTLDFGDVFTGADYWLAIGLRSNGGTSFTPLNPLQQLTPTPYAIYAPSAGSAAIANSVSATNITGVISLAQLPAAVITNDSTNLTLGSGNEIAPLTVPPTVPASAIGSVTAGSDPISVAVAGRYAYVVNEYSSTLQVVDVSTPSAPAIIGSVGTGAYPQSVAVAGRYAYVVNSGSNTLQIFDVSTPSTPVCVGSVGAGGPVSVAIAGRYAYLVNFNASTLQIVDVGIPSAPVSAGSAGTGGGPESVAVAGRYAYVVNGGSNTLQIFDVSTPSGPVNVGSAGTAKNPVRVAVAGRYASGSFGKFFTSPRAAMQRATVSFTPRLIMTTIPANATRCSTFSMARVRMKPVGATRAMRI